MATKWNVKLMTGILLSSLALVGCGQKDNSSSSRVQGSVNNLANTSGATMAQLVAPSDPTALIQALFTGVTSNIGTVDMTNGMQIGGRIKMTTSAPVNGQQTMDSSNSYLVLSVRDSYTMSGQSGPAVYEIGMNSLGSGTYVVASNNVTVYLHDSYGAWIAIQGGFSNSTQFSGTVYIRNGDSGNFQTLGQFTVPTCGLFVCN